MIRSFRDREAEKLFHDQFSKKYRAIERMPKLLTPIHPGEIIREEVLVPLNLSVNQLAKLLAIDTARLNEIVRGRRGITADTALRLARYLGNAPEFWLKLQVHYELRVARQAKQKEIERSVRPRTQAA
jgi:antitoxin HigA-1